MGDLGALGSGVDIRVRNLGVWLKITVILSTLDILALN